MSVLGVTSFFIPDVKALSLSAKSAILINADTNEVLYSLNENEKRGIASTTKILTSIIALEYAEPKKVITATEEAVRIEGTSIGLKAGDTIDLKSLVYGMLLESGNDCANVVAYGISGGINEFSVLMNEVASEIGMKNSSFKNPSGLTQENHYSTAFDMAILTSYAIKNPIFRKICSTKRAVIDFGTPEISRTLNNHNRLLSEYDGVFGVKTGYTKKSGRCLVTAAEKNGVTLVAVTLNAYGDWEDHKKLYDYGFSLYENYELQVDLKSIKIPVVCSDVKNISVEPRKNVSVSVLKTNPELETEVFVEQFLYPPVKKGQIVGELILKNESGKIIEEIPLKAKKSANPIYEEVKEDTASWFYKIKKFTERLSVDRQRT